MILIDVNVLVYAKRLDLPDHAKFEAWLLETLRSDAIVGYSDLILSSVVRVITHPKIFGEPTRLDEALEYVNSLRAHPACIPVVPGEHHWEIFSRLCKGAEARGNLITDAYSATLAIESGAEWITTDRDFARFPGLRWRHPFA